MPALSRAFDPLFRQLGGSIPVAFLRALAARESNFNARANEGEPAAQGLLQITGIVRTSYNQQYGTRYTAAQTLDPEVNIRMAVYLLHLIAKVYGAHPSPNLRTDWNNPDFVGLVVAGWNAGYSNGGGVGKVAGYLERKGIPVTLANVYRYAAAAGAVPKLSNADHQSWTRSVARLFLAQPDRPRGLGGAGTVALILILGWGASKLLA